jgi:mercuric ion transport protein
MIPQRLVTLGALGAVASMLCCVTPLLVLPLTVLGFAGAVAYIDRVVWPLAAAFVLVMAFGLWRLERARRAGTAPAPNGNPQ